MPYDTVEENFRAVGPALTGYASCLPDGEVGPRVELGGNAAAARLQ